MRTRRISWDTGRVIEEVGRKMDHRSMAEKQNKHHLQADSNEKKLASSETVTTSPTLIADGFAFDHFGFDQISSW